MDKSDRLEAYFTEVDIKKIKGDSIINFDLYIKNDKKFVLYKNRNLKLGFDELQRLYDKNFEHLYIHSKDFKNFRTYLETNIGDILKSQDISVQKKAEILFESTVNVVEDIFNNPRSGEAIQRSKEMVGYTVNFIVSAPEAFVNLLKIRRYDYYTFTHSVNVCTFLVSLAQKFGIYDPNVLKEVGEGGLLHDLGKSQISSQIINKNGKLNKFEFEEIKKHPEYGVKIAKDTRDISNVSLSIIGQHHEKVTGNGYPKGLKENELNIYAKMASIVDVYDAITTNRSYSNAKTPVEAVQFLLSHKDEFDKKILTAFVRMLAV
jgi:putative nucleotidyltransferase with HDIG domain